MKKITQTTLIALLISSSVFSQRKGEPVNNPSGGTIVYKAYNSGLILLSPADGKLFSASEGSKPVLFHWTPIVPKPKEPITYRLKVWQLMQGQNSTEAMRSNQPVVTREVVNITQAAISNLYTGPCRPPYLCDFVWAVEALNIDDNKSYGFSNSYSLKYNGGIGTVSGIGGAIVDIKSIDKELDKNQPNAKRVDKELDKSQPTKSLDKELDINQPNTRRVYKELDKSQPIKSLDKGREDLKPVNITERRRPSGDASWELYKVKFPCNCFWCQLKS